MLSVNHREIRGDIKPREIRGNIEPREIRGELQTSTWLDNDIDTDASARTRKSKINGHDRY